MKRDLWTPWMLILLVSGATLPAQNNWPEDLPLTSVSEGLGFNDEPTLAAADDGSIHVAWNSFRNGWDTLQVARYRIRGDQFERLGAWQVFGGKGTYLLGPRAVAAGDRVVVLVAAEVDKNWDIYAVECGPDGPKQPRAVTSDPAVDIKPAGVWHQGTLWVTWESNRDGRRQIAVTSMREGRAGKPVFLSEPRASSYSPSIAVTACGRVAVAWHSFQNNNYDIWLRRRELDGTWRPAVRQTHASSIDRHATLVAHGDELWLLYENALIEPFKVKRRDIALPYRVTRTTRRRVMVARVTARGLLAPRRYAASSPLYARSEAAAAVFDGDGRLWVAFLKPYRGGWQVHMTCWTGNRWLPARRLCARKGMDRYPGVVVVGHRLVVACQVDNIRPLWWRNRRQALAATSNIVLASRSVDEAPSPAPDALAPP